MTLEEGASCPDDLPYNYRIEIPNGGAIRQMTPGTEDHPVLVIDGAYRQWLFESLFEGAVGQRVVSVRRDEYREELVIGLSDGTEIECTGIEGLHISRRMTEGPEALS